MRAVLHGSGSRVSTPVNFSRINSEWTLLETRLRAERSVENATLTLDFEGPGRLWLDRVSLIGDDAVLGLWRSDVTEAVRGLIRA